ncbi:MAG: class I SAM-dependent methyltransferase [Methylobacteriaceae bacterium]|nr:class I SAM-dependent methyltransferase [Methylobacteriaceae bacterium]
MQSSRIRTIAPAGWNGRRVKDRVVDRQATRLEAFRRFLAHIRERFGLDLGFVLWDGSTVPADLPSNAVAVAIADEGAIAGLFRRPRLDTIANLWAAGRLDIRNGTVFDLLEFRPKTRSKELWRSLDKKLVLATAAKFLFVPRGGPWPLEAIGDKRQSDGSAAENKKNISYHYDVSNAFYELWLDPQMVYTCSYFTDWNNSLEQSQIDKLEMICRKLRLRPGETLLDIGCGWGALSCYAAQNYGVKAYGVTLSEQQVAYAQAKIKRLGLGDRARVELKDYADVEGVYDKVAAIGLFEHVGIDNFPKYYKTAHRSLKPGGLFLHHAITRPGKSDAARRRRRPAEFKALTRYIFPGGELDHIGRTVTNLERFGFEVHDVECWREHYQLTCRFWHDRLLANYDAAVREVGAVKTRIWLVYLAACSVTFQRNNAGLYQTLASRRVRGHVDLPPTRADLYR